MDITRRTAAKMAASSIAALTGVRSASPAESADVSVISNPRRF